MTKRRYKAGRYIKTLPSADGKSRGDTYINNLAVIDAEIRVIAFVAENLNKSTDLLGKQLYNDRKRVNSFPEAKNNPLIDIVNDSYFIMMTQMQVIAQKLSAIENSALKIHLAAHDNKQIVDDNLKLPTGLESEMSERLATLEQQIQSLRDQLEDGIKS